MGHFHETMIVDEMRESPKYEALLAAPMREPADVDSPALWGHELGLGRHALRMTGELPANHFWTYAERRWEMAALSGHEARFEHYHRPLMRALERDLAGSLPRRESATFATAAANAHPGTPSDAGAVPEPPSWMLLATAIVVLMVARWWY